MARIPKLEGRLASGCAETLRGLVRGKWLAVGPTGSVLKEFLFPDWHTLLQGVDEPAAGVECRPAMGAGDNDQHAGFADFEASDAVAMRTSRMENRCNASSASLSIAANGHGGIGVVFEIKGAAMAGVVSHNAFKQTTAPSSPA